MPIEEPFPELDRRWAEAIDRSVGGVRAITVLFSGGVDSSLIAAALPRSLPIELLTVGAPGRRDWAAGARAAGRLAREHRAVEIGPASVGSASRAFSELAGRPASPGEAAQIALLLSISYARHPTILVGQGADELFGGYAHFRGLSEGARSRVRERDLAKLLEQDWPLTVRIAASFRAAIVAPFLDPEFRSFAIGLPIEREGADGLTKRRLRRWAIARRIPEEIALRPKVAIQYGTGIGAWLRRAPGVPPVDPMPRRARSDGTVSIASDPGPGPIPDRPR